MKAKSFTKETIREIGMYDRPFPALEIGDLVAVSLRIVEKKDKKDKKDARGDKSAEITERLQVFEGNILAMSKNGISTTFTVRKIGAHGIAIERILPYYSPLIESITVLKKGRVRRAKLYYLRDRVGKAARVKEAVIRKSDVAKKLEA